MRWLSYFILAYLALGLQIGLSEHLRIGSGRPDFVLLAVIFIAINAPHDAALLACFALGVMQDLTSEGSLGIYALSYGLVASFVVSTQQVVYRAHPLTHFSLALVGSLLTMIILLLHGWIRGPALWAQAMPMFYSALYTAILAPFVLGLLGTMRRAFAFQLPRRKIRV